MFENFKKIQIEGAILNHPQDLTYLERLSNNQS